MELALSLGDTSKPFPFLDHHHHHHTSTSPNTNKDLGFCMGSNNNLNPLILGGGGGRRSSHDHQLERKGSSDPPLQLDLIPFSPLQRHPPPPPPPLSQPRFPWLAQNLISESGKKIEMNRQQVSATTTTVVEEGEDGAALSSSPNSAVSSYNNHQMDFTSMFRKRKRDFLEAGTTRGINSSNNNNNNNSSGELLFLENGERSGGDEEDINGLDRKKLRLTKDQSAFLEESFKEHTTLNPKQKLALAKQLNLRPRQVEVWFQNRRARTKLKQTEVDCEYLKRCCETLTEENRRLQKEVQELRALKSSKPFYMQLPATTLTMCPSCERVASTTTTAAAAVTTATTTVTSTATVSVATTNTTLSLASS